MDDNVWEYPMKLVIVYSLYWFIAKPRVGLFLRRIWLALIVVYTPFTLVLFIRDDPLWGLSRNSDIIQVGYVVLGTPAFILAAVAILGTIGYLISTLFSHNKQGQEHSEPDIIEEIRDMSEAKNEPTEDT